MHLPPLSGLRSHRVRGRCSNQLAEVVVKNTPYTPVADLPIPVVANIAEFAATMGWTFRGSLALYRVNHNPFGYPYMLKVIGATC